MHVLVVCKTYKGKIRQEDPPVECIQGTRISNPVDAGTQTFFFPYLRSISFN